MPTTSNFGWTTPADTDLVKDGAAAIRTLGNGIDTSFVDLKGGTTGQLLSKASNTDLDFTWTAAGLSASIIDAKGDLIAGTANDTAGRLAVGTNNQVLTADSSTSTGLKWSTPASGWTLITSGTLSSTTTTVSSISGAYTDLKIVFTEMTSSTSAQDIWMTFNNTDGIYNPGTIFTDGSDTWGPVNNASISNVIVNNCNTNGADNHAELYIPSYSRTDCWKFGTYQGWNRRGTDATVYHWFWYSQRIGIDGAINRFDVTAQAGNLSGNYYVYGI